MREKVSNKSKMMKVIIISLVLFLVVFSIVVMIIVKNLYDGNFPRFNRPEFTTDLSYSDVSENYKRDTVQFKSGDNTLQGYIYGVENTKGLVVVAHGLGAGSDSYLSQIMTFVDDGWRVFTYDCTGSYDSEGKSTKGFPQSVLDLDAALTYIESKEEFENFPVLLFGHSWGGYAVANVLNFDHEVDGVVSVAGVNTAFEITMEECNNIMGGFSKITAPYIWLYQTILFGKNASVSAVNGINQSNVPVMIIHGDHDTRVLYNGSSIIAHKDEIKNSKVIYKTCTKEFHNGHSDLFLSDEARQYDIKVDEEYIKMNEKYSGKIPHDIEKEFYENVDKFLINELDSELMKEINTFYYQCVEQ